MSDNDLIRREYIGPRLAISGFGGKALQDAIAELPAVTVGEDVAKAAINRAIERLRALPNHAGRPAWDAIVAEEIRAALEPVAAPDPAHRPTMTDMMVDPDTLDAFMEANPLPDTPDPAAIREAVLALRRHIVSMPHGDQEAVLLSDALRVIEEGRG